MPRHTPETPEHERIYIREAAAFLKRRIGTLRGWEAEGVLDKKLLPRRGKRNWRYWTQEQLDQIQEWIIETDRRPGKALNGLRDTPDQKSVEAHIEAMRKPHRPSFEGDPAPHVRYPLESKYNLTKTISPDPLRARIQVGYDKMTPTQKRVFTREYNARFARNEDE